MSEVNEESRTELIAYASGLFDIAKGVEINSASMYEIAASELGYVKQAIKDLTERRMIRTRKLDEIKALIIDDYRPAIDKLGEAKNYYEQGMLTYNRGIELLRKQEQARLDAIAKQAKDKLEEEARIANAAAAKIEAEAQALAAKSKNAAQAAKILADAAEKAEEQRQAAEAALLTAQVVTAAPTSIDVAKAQGTSVRETWKARCTDKLELLKFIVSRPEYLELIDVNASALNGIARSQKKNMKVGGCESYIENGITTRSKK